jgi:hypothetical protein
LKSELETLEPRWNGPIVVAATGSSLSRAVAAQVVESGCPIICVKQAALRLPTADVLYICDAAHWDQYQGYPEFHGERWSSHGSDSYDNKLIAAKKHNLRLVRGVHGNRFSADPSHINYGNSSGFQAIGLAVHWLQKPGRIVVVGLDMQGGYFYGLHPRWGANQPPLHSYIRHFEEAAKSLPDGVEIVLGTSSALTCFPAMPLAQALAFR